MEIQIDGDELDVQCPRCNGKGYLLDFPINSKEMREYKCGLCGGEGMIEDVPCYGEIEVDLEPKCPNCGNHVQDPRGAAYAKLTANFIGYCGRPGCEACVNNPQTSLPVF